MQIGSKEYQLEKLFFYLKGLTIVHWAMVALKNLWPFLLIILFWPEIDKLCSSIPYWNEYMGTVSGIISQGSDLLRQIPVISDIIAFFSEFIDPIKSRIISILR